MPRRSTSVLLATVLLVGSASLLAAPQPAGAATPPRQAFGFMLRQVLPNGDPGLCAAVGHASAKASALLASCTPAVDRVFAVTTNSSGLSLFALSTGICLDVLGASTKNDANVVSLPCDTSDHGQQWTRVGSGQRFALRSNTSSQAMCLDSRNALTTIYTPLVQGNCTSSLTQRWDFVPALMPQPAPLKQLGSGLCGVVVTVSWGTTVRLGSCSSAADRNFFLQPIEPTSNYQVVLQNAGTNQVCLAVEWPGWTDGARVLATPCSGDPTQTWSVIAGPNHSSMLVNWYSGMCLNTDHEQWVAGTQLVQRTCATRSDFQEFAVIDATGAPKLIHNGATDTCMVMALAQANYQLGACVDTADRAFYLQKNADGTVAIAVASMFCMDPRTFEPSPVPCDGSGAQGFTLAIANTLTGSVTFGTRAGTCVARVALNSFLFYDPCDGTASQRWSLQ